MGRGTELLGDLEWSDLKVLLALGRSGSIAGAARALAVDGSTVSRRLAAAEQALGAVLIVRGGRTFSLTEEGKAVVAAAEVMESAVVDAAAAVRRARSGLQGIVRIACPRVAVAFLAEFHARVAERHPGLGVDLFAGRAPIDHVHFAVRVELAACDGRGAAAESGGYEIPPEATLDCARAEAILAGKNEFIFDIQTHHIEYEGAWRTTNPTSGATLVTLFSEYNGCKESDLERCIDADTYLQLVFLESDTTVAVLSGFSAAICRQERMTRCGSPLDNDDLARSVERVNALARSQRVVNHCQVNPTDELDLSRRAGEVEPQIEAFRAFQISQQFQEQYGYPALTNGSGRLPRTRQLQRM